MESRRTNLGRSRSAQSLKNLDQSGTEDKLTLVTQIFWITVSMLESDYEYEFLLAVRLLNRVSEGGTCQATVLMHMDQYIDYDCMSMSTCRRSDCLTG